MKLVQRQELVVGGWTEPRRSRAAFGALLLGELGRDRAALRRPRRQRIHRGAICTASARCWRRARSRSALLHAAAGQRAAALGAARAGRRGPVLGLDRRRDHAPRGLRRAARRRPGRQRAPRGRSSGRRAGGRRPPPPRPARSCASCWNGWRQIEALQRVSQRRAGAARRRVAGGHEPEQEAVAEAGLTKGDLLRYYVERRAADPAGAARPAAGHAPVPERVAEPAFYQQRAPKPAPAGVRVQALTEGRRGAEPRGRRLARHAALHGAAGGDLAGPLVLARGRRAMIDFAAIDLDPGADGDVRARARRRAMDARRARRRWASPAFAKTSGARGLHIYIPMRAGDALRGGAAVLPDRRARWWRTQHPAPRRSNAWSKRRRPARSTSTTCRTSCGKTIASAYSARASDYAGASAPVTWEEIDEGVDPRDFTIRTMPARIRSVGDLWSKLRRSRGVISRPRSSVWGETRRPLIPRQGLRDLVVIVPTPHPLTGGSANALTTDSRLSSLLLARLRTFPGLGRGGDPADGARGPRRGRGGRPRSAGESSRSSRRRRACPDRRTRPSWPPSRRQRASRPASSTTSRPPSPWRTSSAWRAACGPGWIPRPTSG